MAKTVPPKIEIVEDQEPVIVEPVTETKEFDYASHPIPLEDIDQLLFTDGRELFQLDTGRVRGDYILRAIG